MSSLFGCLSPSTTGQSHQQSTKSSTSPPRRNQTKKVFDTSPDISPPLSTTAQSHKSLTPRSPTLLKFGQKCNPPSESLVAPIQRIARRLDQRYLNLSRSANGYSKTTRYSSPNGRATDQQPSDVMDIVTPLNSHNLLTPPTSGVGGGACSHQQYSPLSSPPKLSSSSSSRLVTSINNRNEGLVIKQIERLYGSSSPPSTISLSLSPNTSCDSLNSSSRKPKLEVNGGDGGGGFFTQRFKVCSNEERKSSSSSPSKQDGDAFICPDSPDKCGSRSVEKSSHFPAVFKLLRPEFRDQLKSSSSKKSPKGGVVKTPSNDLESRIIPIQTDENFKDESSQSNGISAVSKNSPKKTKPTSLFSDTGRSFVSPCSSSTKSTKQSPTFEQIERRTAALQLNDDKKGGGGEESNHHCPTTKDINKFIENHLNWSHVVPNNNNNTESKSEQHLVTVSRQAVANGEYTLHKCDQQNDLISVVTTHSEHSEADAEVIDEKPIDMDVTLQSPKILETQSNGYVTKISDPEQTLYELKNDHLPDLIESNNNNTSVIYSEEDLTSTTNNILTTIMEEEDDDDEGKETGTVPNLEEIEVSLPVVRDNVDEKEEARNGANHVVAFEQHSPFDGHHFLKLLENEIFKFEENICDFEDENNPAIDENVREMILTCIGKTKLLINKKLAQFKQLCEKNIKNDVEDKFVPTGDDLAGFWDMVFIQIQQLHTSFQHLIDIRNNNWVIPETQKIVEDKKKIGRPVLNGGRRKSVPSTVNKTSNVNNSRTSSIAKAKEEARKRLMMEAKLNNRRRSEADCQNTTNSHSSAVFIEF